MLSLEKFEDFWCHNECAIPFSLQQCCIDVVLPKLCAPVKSLKWGASQNYRTAESDHLVHCPYTEHMNPEPVLRSVSNRFLKVSSMETSVSLVNTLKLLLAFKLEDSFYHTAIALKAGGSLMSVCSSIFFWFVLPCKGTVTR